ncbi:MAG: hypothetical protein EA361_00915 [Bacteroidetes bacterium]|nr:MAG: hypothetical protein EA361_00915 [Bacteroidota bacterium]
MKTRKQVFATLIALSFAVLPFMSCEKMDDPLKDQPRKEKPDCVSAAIVNVNMPDEIQVGKPAVFAIEFAKPTPCYEFEGFFLNESTFVLNLKVCLSAPGADQVCPQVIEFEEQQFTRTFSKSGTWVLRYTGESGPETIEFEVL